MTSSWKAELIAGRIETFVLHQSPVAVIHEEGILSRKQLVLYWVTGVHIEVTATFKGVVTLHNVHLETLKGDHFLD